MEELAERIESCNGLHTLNQAEAIALKRQGKIDGIRKRKAPDKDYIHTSTYMFVTKEVRRIHNLLASCYFVYVVFD